MTHIRRCLAVSAPLLLWGSISHATPNIAPQCEADHLISNPTSSPATPYYFNDSCSTVYVAPPESGEVQLTSFLEHVNLGSCDALRDAQASADDRVITIDTLQDMLDGILLDYIDPDSQWNESYTDAKLESRTARAELALAEAEQENAQASLTFMTGVKNAALVEFSSCKSRHELDVLLGNTTLTLQEYCAAEIDVYIEASGNETDAQLAKLDADMAYNTANAIYNSKKDVLEDMDSELLTATSRATQIELTIQGQRSLMQGIFTEYSQMYAGIGNLQYDSNWGDLVNEYQETNSDSGLSFTKLPIDRAFVLISNDDRFVNPSEALAERTGVLNVSIPLLGLSNYGITDMPIGVNPDTAHVQPGLPDTFSGTVEFALALGCSIKDNGMGDFGNFVGVSMNFDYTLKARGGYTATYDKKTFLEVIKKVASQNSWFFKRKTVRETSISENTEMDFSITFFADAEGFEFSPEEKASLSSSVKERLMIDVLDSIGVRSGANTAEAELPEPSVGSQLGGRLVSTCRYGLHWGCYGGWILVGLDGLFGSQEAENRFRQENAASATETYTDTFFVTKWGSLSFGS